MMLVIEYLHVRTQGFWEQRLRVHRWGQYLLAAILGASPGCLGAFAMVALYTHRRVSLGALVATMLATAGDESFVMFAMVPQQALSLHAVLLLLGIIAGVLTDLVVGNRFDRHVMPCDGLALHPEHQEHAIADTAPWTRDWRTCSMSRGVLGVGLLGLLLATTGGQIGPPVWNWLRMTIVLVVIAAFTIVATVSDHFLEEHLWRHIVIRHIPRVFAWTLGSLLLLHVMATYLDITPYVQHGAWVMLVLACLVGIIPESGPHLVFVTLFAQGMVPLSVLLASSIVQDGHGMLPLLAHSRRAFLVVKAINVLIAVLVGGAMILWGR
jgi:hypothetical protein